MPEQKWFKGNIHTHTTESDGDASPQRVVSWYRRHGYDFLVLSDHNHLTLLDYGRSRRRRRLPLMIPGEEVSVNLDGGATAIHINAIGITRVVEPTDATDVVSTIQANINAILEAGGIASINHPNYKWSFDHEAIVRVSGASLLEVFNGHPATNVYGAPGRPGNEQIWDHVLSAGKAIFGVATDDSHNYSDFSHARSNPGRGWVMVRADELSSEAVVEGLAAGSFYSSTGVTLTELEISNDAIRLAIDQERDFVYTTSFTGPGAVLLHEVVGREADYEIRGGEGYVRATVRASSGQKAWAQPVFLR